MPEDVEPARQPFTLAELPEWVESFGLPEAAVDAIDRYWKPAWDAIEDALPLLPIQSGRSDAGRVPAAGVPPETICFDAVEELRPGAKWRSRFHQMWPAYRAWYLRDGVDARPDLSACRERLNEHMPELVDTYELLVELADGDELAARCLSLYSPPTFIVGCSQGIWTQGSPMLVRNYDYPPERLEGVIIKTAWTGRRIVGMSDCLWGLLDGMNDAGLVVSLTFGGRRTAGEGFAIPLIVRYLLETCETVPEAREALTRLPVHAAQNLSLLDRGGEHLTAYLAPDHGPRFSNTPVTTNHQGEIDWPEYASAVHTVEREQHLLQALEHPEMTPERFIDTFLKPPLHNRDYKRGMGTLYTAAYFPNEDRVEYRWPGHVWRQSIADFKEASHLESLFGPRCRED